MLKAHFIFQGQAYLKNDPSRQTGTQSYSVSRKYPPSYELLHRWHMFWTGHWLCLLPCRPVITSKSVHRFLQNSYQILQLHIILAKSSLTNIICFSAKPQGKCVRLLESTSYIYIYTQSKCIVYYKTAITYNGPHSIIKYNRKMVNFTACLIFFQVSFN